MAYWEFLLQQEGDRDWLPLETAHVEILEGRYRIMAHTSHCEVPAEIRLTQILYDPMPPKRRTLRRSGCTNAEGLMLVMPFTHLAAGIWTIRCESADPAIVWQYGVQIRVLPLEADPEDWQPDWPEDSYGEGVAGGTLDVEATASSFMDMLSDPWEVPAASEEDSQPEPPAIDLTTLGALPYRLHLQQQALMVRQEEPIVLRGEVVGMEEPSPALPLQADLWVQLRDPNQGTSVAHQRRSLSLAALPTDFEITVALPTAIEARLLVGEMSLWQATQPPQPLAIQGFTVTVNLDALLETIANQGDPALTSTDAFTEVGLEVGATLDAPAIPNVREVPFRRIYLPATGLTLPPQIYRPRPSESAIPAPQLPALPNQTARTAPSSPNSAEATPRALELPPISASTVGDASPTVPPAPVVPSDTSPTEPTAPKGIELPAFGKTVPAVTEAGEALNPLSSVAIAPTNPENPPLPDAPLPGLPKDQAFQSLNLQSRFWSRLSALAQEGHAEALTLKTEMTAAGIVADTATEAVLPNLGNVPGAEVSTPAIDHEVVVYDPLPDEGEVAFPPEGNLGRPLNDPSRDSSEDVPIVPMPILELPTGELVAGTPLSVEVRLPLSPNRLAVKFWITDVQSRSLLEKPRWLMTWTPNDPAEQTTRLQLQVPLGCLKVRFEAIAVDLTNQQESYKTTLERSITPPNLVDEG